MSVTSAPRIQAVSLQIRTFAAPFQMYSKERSMRFRNVAALLILLFASAGVALAQETTGTISGRVVDAQGLAVPGVSVTATGPQGMKMTVTDTDGRFSIRFLTPGSYEVQ